MSQKVKVKVEVEFEIPLEVANAIQNGDRVEQRPETWLKVADGFSVMQALYDGVQTLPFQRKEEKIFTIFIALPSGKTRAVLILEGIPMGQQYLRHKGKLLWGATCDCTQSLAGSELSELDIRDCSTIQLSIRHAPVLGPRRARTGSPPPQSHGRLRPAHRESSNPPPRSHRRLRRPYRVSPNAPSPPTVQPPLGAPVIDGPSQVGETNDQRSAQPIIFSKTSISIMGAGISAGHTITLPTAWLGLTLRTVAEIVSAREGVLLKDVSLYADGQLVFSGICAVMEEVLQLRALSPKQRDNLRAVIWTENVNPATQPSLAASTEGDYLYD